MIGMRILLVEDEPLIAMTTSDMLAEIGCIVVATAPDVPAALAAIEDVAFDAALLDVQLGEDTCLPIAERLRARGTPYLVTSGYGATALLPHDSAPVLPKPYTLGELETALTRLTD